MFTRWLQVLSLSLSRSMRLLLLCMIDSYLYWILSGRSLARVSEWTRDKREMKWQQIDSYQLGMWKLNQLMQLGASTRGNQLVHLSSNGPIRRRYPFRYFDVGRFHLKLLILFIPMCSSVCRLALPLLFSVATTFNKIRTICTNDFVLRCGSIWYWFSDLS